jgi:4-hydroxybenzoate polyprenyltransferase
LFFGAWLHLLTEATKSNIGFITSQIGPSLSVQIQNGWRSQSKDLPACSDTDILEPLGIATSKPVSWKPPSSKIQQNALQWPGTTNPSRQMQLDNRAVTVQCAQMEVMNQMAKCDSADVPLVVDLDGTLLRTDLLFEATLRLMKQKFWLVLLLPLWLLKGRAHLKSRIFHLSQIDVSLLPLHSELLTWLRAEKSRGRRLILATGSDAQKARSVVLPLDLFDLVLGSNGERNLTAGKKLRLLAETCGEQFDYVGNSRSDLEIWRGCRHAVLVNASMRVQRSARRSAHVVQVFPASFTGIRGAFDAMRCHHWVKNLLVFVPAITSHTIFDATVAEKSLLAFFSFSFCASAAYIVNDLLDLEEDRRHEVKKHRPFASGRMSIGSGLLLASTCLLVSLGTAGFLPRPFFAVLAIYFLLTCLYSFFLKRLLLVDVLTLALLYTLRIVAGSHATGIVLSLWLLSFGFFLFLSLAFLKRAADLVQQRAQNRNVVPGRGYTTTDLEPVSIAGMCSGLFRSPALLWGLQPILLYYVMRLWIICRRGELNIDPIEHTAKEPSTYAAALLAFLVLLAATFDFTLVMP